MCSAVNYIYDDAVVRAGVKISRVAIKFVACPSNSVQYIQCSNCMYI